MSYNDQKGNLEQYMGKNSLEIYGIPEEVYNSTVNVINKLGKELQVPILPEDIDISQKLFSSKYNPRMNIATTPKNRQLSLLATAQVQPKRMKFNSLHYLRDNHQLKSPEGKKRNTMDCSKLLLQTSNATSQEALYTRKPKGKFLKTVKPCILPSKYNALNSCIDDTKKIIINDMTKLSVPDQSKYRFQFKDLIPWPPVSIEHIVSSCIDWDMG